VAERGLAHQKHSKISRLLPPSLAVCTTFMCHFQMRFILLSIACAVSIVVEVLSAFAQTPGVGSIPGSFDVFVRDQRLKSIISRVYEKPIDMNAGAGRIVSRYELGVLQSEMPQTVFFLRRCINMARVMMDLRCNQQPSLILFLRSDGKSFPSSAVLADRERLGAAYRFAHFAPSGNLTDMLFATRVCFS
jgi:hypothetical protein